MERKRYYRCLSGTATVYFEQTNQPGCMTAVNLCAEDTLEVTGEVGVYWAGDVHQVQPDSLADYVERVASLVEEYEFLIAREERRACMAYPLGA